MTRKQKIWAGLSAGVVLLILLAAAAVGGAYLYREHRNQQWLADAEKYFAEGNWRQAKDHFALYLVQYPDDESALTKYAEANLNILQFRRGSLAQAATAYRQLLQYHPDSDEILDKLFELYQRTGSWLQIEYYANDMLRSRPDDEDLLYHRALALDNLGRRDEAIEAYRGLVERGNASAKIYGSLARLLRERGYEQQALDLLEKVVKERPDDVALRVERARYFGYSRGWDNLEAELAEAVQLDPDDPDVLVLEAQRAVMKKDWDRAIELSNEVLERAPDRLDVYLMGAHALTRKGEPEKAAALLGQLEPMTLVDNPELLVTLADLQISLQRFEDADASIALFEQAYPERTGMIDYLAGRKLMAQGDYVAATEILASVADRLPSFAPAQYFLAVAYRECGREELARNTLEAYLKKRPEDARARALLAARSRGTVSASEYETAAVRMLTESKEDDTPADPEACVSTALALFEASEREGSSTNRLATIQELFEQAIRDDPERPSAYRAYTDVLVAVNDLSKAREVLQRALDAGISEQVLAPAQANLAIAEGDRSRAWTLFERSAESLEISPNDYLSWSSLFAGRGMTKQAEDVLVRGVERAEQGLLSSSNGMPEAAATMLSIEQLMLAARAGDIDGVVERLDSLARSEAASQGAIRSRLNAARLVVAEQLLNRKQEETRKQGFVLLEQVRQEEPENGALQTMDAQLLLRKSPPEVDKAEALLQSAVKTDPNNAAAWMGLAHVSNFRGDLGQAADHAERAASLAPNSIPIQLQLAQLQVRVGRYLPAEKVLTAILAQASETPGEDGLTALELLASCYISGKRLSDAERTTARLESAVGQNPDWTKRLDSLKTSLLMARGITDPRAADEARKTLQQQYEAEPDNFSLMLRFSGALRQAGQEGEAVQSIQDYAARHQDNVEVWLALARFHLSGEEVRSSQQLAAASTALTQALVLEPDYLPALREMVEVQVRMGNFSQALALCDHYLERKQDDPGVLHRKASLMARMAAGQEAELWQALRVVDEAIALEERPEFLASKGTILLALGDYEEALKSLQPLASGYGTTTAELDAALAEAYVGVGDLDLAQDYLASAKRKAGAGQPVDARVLERVSSKLEELK